MDDYISKPVDERLLQSKIILFLTKAYMIRQNRMEENVVDEIEKYTNLTYLVQRTTKHRGFSVEQVWDLPL